MGYTHYWTRTNRVPTAEQWREFTDFVTAIIQRQTGQCNASAGGYYKTVPLAIAWADGLAGTRPEITDELVCFNGCGKGVNGEGMDHESFLLYRDHQKEPDAFCKTDRKPYDLIVVACLERARMLGFLEWHSDGDKADVSDGIALAKGVYAGPDKPGKPKRPRLTIEECTVAVAVALPQLTVEVDRDWVWVVGNLQGDANKPARETLKQLGFRFKPHGDHVLPSGAVARWAHACLRPTKFKFKGKDKSGGESTDGIPSDDAELLRMLEAA